MLNTFDNFTLNSIFLPKAFIKKKHVFLLIKAFGRNIELRVKLFLFNLHVQILTFSREVSSLPT